MTPAYSGFVKHASVAGTSAALTLGGMGAGALAGTATLPILGALAGRSAGAISGRLATDKPDPEGTYAAGKEIEAQRRRHKRIGTLLGGGVGSALLAHMLISGAGKLSPATGTD